LRISNISVGIFGTPTTLQQWNNLIGLLLGMDKYYGQCCLS
jgi:hypothetical protein